MLGPRSKIQDRMAGLFTRQAAEYAAARPVYPKDLFVKLASLTAHHRVAWDVGTGNGQAAIGVSTPILQLSLGCLHKACAYLTLAFTGIPSGLLFARSRSTTTAWWRRT
jgi:hypothetical protein